MTKSMTKSLTEPRSVRLLLIGLMLGFLGLFLIAPLAVVILQALQKGTALYLLSLRQPETLAAVRLTLGVTALTVAANLIFGLAAAWLITRFRFPGKELLNALIDLPLGVSPVIAGMIFVLLLGQRSPIGGFLAAHGLQIIFAVPGIVLATLFVTMPYIARELIPVMEAQGMEEEEAALMLGASGAQIFFRITLPNIKWGLLYGVVLSSARAMGEFGAVSVVSGHIRGLTNTLPLHVEALYNEYQFAAAFAVASLMAGVAVATLVGKQLLALRATRQKNRPKDQSENQREDQSGNQSEEQREDENEHRAA